MAKFLNAQIKDGKIIQADILLSDSEIKENPFANIKKEAAFYHLITDTLIKANATLSGESEDTQTKPEINCTHINVAKNIQDSWYDYASKNNIDAASLTMSLAFAGPKALDEIPNNQVQILINCLSYEEPEQTIPPENE